MWNRCDFDWQSYLDLAVEIAGAVAVRPGAAEGALSQADQARLRCAVSRAYYAAFHKALAYQQARMPFSESAEPVHAAVRDRFKNSANRTLWTIGNNLGLLLADRRKADYDDYIDNLAFMAEKALERANRVVTDISGL